MYLCLLDYGMIRRYHRIQSHADSQSNVDNVQDALRVPKRGRNRSDATTCSCKLNGSKYEEAETVSCCCTVITSEGAKFNMPEYLSYNIPNSVLIPRLKLLQHPEGGSYLRLLPRSRELIVKLHVVVTYRILRGDRPPRRTSALALCE